jgi:hypothetical protein
MDEVQNEEGNNIIQLPKTLREERDVFIYLFIYSPALM